MRKEASLIKRPSTFLCWCCYTHVLLWCDWNHSLLRGYGLVGKLNRKTPAGLFCPGLAHKGRTCGEECSGVAQSVQRQWGVHGWSRVVSGMKPRSQEEKSSGDVRNRMLLMEGKPDIPLEYEFLGISLYDFCIFLYIYDIFFVISSRTTYMHCSLSLINIHIIFIVWYQS